MVWRAVREELGNTMRRESDGDIAGDMATIWRRCPKKIATAKLLPNKPGVGGYSIVKFHATGDSSPCPYLAEARGTSASRNWLS